MESFFTLLPWPCDEQDKGPDFYWTCLRLPDLLREPTLSAGGAYQCSGAVLGLPGLEGGSGHLARCPSNITQTTASRVPRTFRQAPLPAEGRETEAASAQPWYYSTSLGTRALLPCSNNLGKGHGLPLDHCLCTALASGWVPSSGALPQTSVLPHGPPPASAGCSPRTDTYRRLSNRIVDGTTSLPAQTLPVR